MGETDINYWAVLVAALSTFLLGGLWYSPLLFAKPWMKANGFSQEDVDKGNQAKILGLAFLFALVMSFNLAGFLSSPDTTAAWGATAGFLAGFGWVAMAIGTISLFERRPWSYVLINGGFQVVAFVVMGAILGAWR